MSKFPIASFIQFFAVGIASTALWVLRDFDGYPFMAGFGFGCATMVAVTWLATRRRS